MLAQLGDGSPDCAGDEPSDEQLMKDAEKAFEDIFCVGPPRDVFAGTWSGIKCALSGILLGLAGFVSQPIEGAREEGVLGCCKGTVVGACTAVLLSVTGVVTGLYQTFRGVIATPRSVRMFLRGDMLWNAEIGSWGPRPQYSLKLEATHVLEGPNADDGDDDDFAPTVGSGNAMSSKPRRRVADMTYYDALEIRPEATMSEVRRAYYKQSKKWHPDKASGDRKAAKEKFQTISEAYQVLSDAQRRKQYDANGRGNNGEAFIDAQVFFAVLFGSEALEAHIGRLRIAEMFELGEGLDGKEEEESLGSIYEDLAREVRELEIAESRKQQQQLRRQVKLACELVERLQPAEKLYNEEFADLMRQEALAILQKDASLRRFLQEIGWIYVNRSAWYLAYFDSRLGAWSVGAWKARLHRQGRGIRQKAMTAKFALQSYLKLRKIANETLPDSTDQNQNDGNHSDLSKESEDAMSVLNDSMPTFMEVLWNLTVLDISSTLDKVIEKTLMDESVDIVIRRRRAEALRILGQTMTSVASTGSDQGDQETRRRFEEAFQAAAANVQ